MGKVLMHHTLVDSGLRWHMRVFDLTTIEFRDLVISGIEEAPPIVSRLVHGSSGRSAPAPRSSDGDADALPNNHDCVAMRLCNALIAALISSKWRLCQ